MGIEEPGLEHLARVGFDTLGLQTYLTAGPKETRAWTIRKGATAPEAAGVIHTDFQKGFIKAEIVSFDDLVAAGSMQKAKGRQGPHGGQGVRHGRRGRRGVPLRKGVRWESWTNPMGRNSWSASRLAASATRNCWRTCVG
jgi:hypothetical protein